MTAETSNARGEWKDWIRDREQVVGLADHLEQVGWRQDERGDVQCFDQGAAMAAEVIRLVLLPMLDRMAAQAPEGALVFPTAGNLARQLRAMEAEFDRRDPYADEDDGPWPGESVMAFYQRTGQDGPLREVADAMNKARKES